MIELECLTAIHYWVCHNFPSFWMYLSLPRSVLVFDSKIYIVFIMVLPLIGIFGFGVAGELNLNLSLFE